MKRDIILGNIEAKGIDTEEQVKQFDFQVGFCFVVDSSH